MGSVRRRLRRLPAHVRPRRLHLYGVGHGKTGTTSLARMFAQYRSDHQLDNARFVPITIAALNGEVAAGLVRRELRRRSWRFHLEVDVASFLAPFAATLAGMYPDAKFVLTIRDCFSWLDSRVESHLHVPRESVRYAYSEAQYGRYGEPFQTEERSLRDAGLHPVASYLRYWAEINAYVLAAVPPDRLLVVRTEDLDASLERIAEFAGVPATTLSTARENANPERTGLLGTVPRSYILAVAREHCAPLMQQFWGPDWCDVIDRGAGPPTEGSR